MSMNVSVYVYVSSFFYSLSLPYNAFLILLGILSYLVLFNFPSEYVSEELGSEVSAIYSFLDINPKLIWPKDCPS